MFQASSSSAVPRVEPQAVEWPAKRVREAFVEFFESRGHVFSPWINNQTHLTSAWTEFLGIRAGGNDHTLLEILGNSSTDYFKTHAILLAWELLTEVYKLPQDRFYATYFGGDERVGLAPDHEARDIWLKLLPTDTERVLPFGCKDNFWETGDTGPCGPYTGIYYDRIGNRDAASLVHSNDPTCIEIWDLLFLQLNRNGDGSLKPLPVKYVDTVMDFKRVTSVLQNQMSTYDTDMFLPIYHAIQQATGALPYSGKVGVADVDQVDMAYRIVADHLRALSFAISVGSCPGNDSCGSDLRQILRQAVHYGYNVLKANEEFVSGLVHIVVTVMGEVYPMVKQHEARIREIVKVEETIENTLQMQSGGADVMDAHASAANSLQMQSGGADVMDAHAAATNTLQMQSGGADVMDAHPAAADDNENQRDENIETFNRASQDVQDNTFSGQLMAEESEDGVDPFVRGLHNLLAADSPDTRKIAFWHQWRGCFKVAGTIRLKNNGPTWRRYFGQEYSAQEFQRELLTLGFEQPWRHNEGDKSKAKLWRFSDKNLFTRDSSTSTLQQIKAARVPD